jgi:hypothetical protein
VSRIPIQFIIAADGKIVEAVVGYDDGDGRLEACLARAGLKVNPAMAVKGEEQTKKDE